MVLDHSEVLSWMCSDAYTRIFGGTDPHPQADAFRRVRLVSLAAQSFLAGVTHDALQVGNRSVSDQSSLCIYGGIFHKHLPVSQVSAE